MGSIENTMGLWRDCASAVTKDIRMASPTQRAEVPSGVLNYPYITLNLVVPPYWLHWKH